MTETMTKMRELLNTRFGGVLRSGRHDPNGECCILELASQAQGLAWTDDPEALGVWDFRQLNDASWSSDAMRTEHMLRLYEAFEGSARWPAERQRQVIETIVLRTVREVIAELPGLTDELRDQLRGVASLEDAERAASWAVRAASYASYAARAARAASWAASDAASGASYAAGDAARAVRAASYAARADAGLIHAVNIWIEAANKTGGTL